MSIQRKISNAAERVTSDVYETVHHHAYRLNEKLKFRDKRRREIANQYPLTQEQKDKIDEFFIKNYGQKIGYVWHQNYAAHAGKFDYRLFPELLYVPEFEAFQNQNRAAVRMMGDKNFLPLLAKAAGVKVPRTIISCTNGVLRDGENHIINDKEAEELLSSQGEFFIKPSVDSCSGQGCLKVESGSEYAVKDNKIEVKNGPGGGYFYNYVAQEIIKCHQSINAIYPGSVNTFRVITYIWRGEIELMPIIIRIGRGGNFLDNAHAGGIFCAVQNDGRMGNHAVTEFNVQFMEHPDTHLIFANHRIEHIDRVIEAARKMHEAIPQIGVVNWDFTIDEKGDAVLIESNVKNGSVWLPQMAHGIGAFGDKTAEVLQWLRFMKKLKPHERSRYVHGKIE